MIESFFSAVVFSIVMLGSPGPAVIALLYSGARYGVSKTVPFFLGIILGFLLNLVVSALFYSGAFKIDDSSYLLFKVISYVYIAYIAFCIAKSPPFLEENQTFNPLKWTHGFLLNITNPKAYIASFTSFSIFVMKEDYMFSMVIVFLINLTMAVLLQGCWVIIGGKIRNLFANRIANRAINVFFASLLIMIIAYSLYNDFF